MKALDPESRRIKQEIMSFDSQIEEMHIRVHKYLLDRSKNPHPRHEQLISRIMNYQIKGVRSRELELRLENIQHKALTRANVWKRWFEDDAKGLFKKGKVESSSQEKKTENNPLMDKVYERTKDLWTQHGVTSIELKEDFMASATHELRTPIASIKSLLEILNEKETIYNNSDLFELITICHHNINRLSNLTDNILEFSVRTRRRL